MELAPGALLLGKYRVIDVIGTGGMGRVVRASHLYLQQPVAIKLLLPEMAASPSTVARFLREAQATVQLKSEHIARVIDVGTLPDGTPFMIMEYLEGNDLNQILRHHGPQAPGIVCDLMLQACEGMAEAHAAGIIHRDIKPSNFFITQRPDGSMLLKILDFGISKTPVGYGELTGTQTVIGTPSYMAPEHMKSGRHADQRSDIWSIGVVMYQLLQGRPPFSGESYAELVLAVGTEAPAPIHVPLPAGLGEVILRCLEKDPKQRYQNVGELARMLAPFSTDPITAAQIATRTTRILQVRTAHPGAAAGASYGQQVSPYAAGGGYLTPAPLSPAQLTSGSWPPSTSTAVGRGQVTHRTRGATRWIVAGALSLAILAGAGGFIANELMKDGSTHVPPPPPAASAARPEAAPPPTAPAASAPTPAAAPTAPPAAPVAPAEVAASSPWKPTAPEPTLTAPTAIAPTAIAPTAEPKPATPTTTTTTAPTVTPKITANTAPGTTAKTVAKTAAKPTPKPTPKPSKAAPPKPTRAKPTRTKPTGTRKPARRDTELFDRRD